MKLFTFRQRDNLGVGARLRVFGPNASRDIDMRDDCVWRGSSFGRVTIRRTIAVPSANDTDIRYRTVPPRAQHGLDAYRDARASSAPPPRLLAKRHIVGAQAGTGVREIVRRAKRRQAALTSTITPSEFSNAICAGNASTTA